MKRILFATLAAAVAGPALAADSYSVDARHTFPGFEVNHLGFSTQRGRFNKTTGKIVLDRHAKTGSVDIEIDATSVDTGLDKLEEHLRGEEFFNTAKFPTLTFKSKSVKFSGDKPSAVEGDFTGMKFGLANALKDVRYYNQMAMEFGVSGNMASATLQTLTQAVNMGFGGPEHLVASLVPAVARINNVPFPPK